MEKIEIYALDTFPETIRYVYDVYQRLPKKTRQILCGLLGLTRIKQPEVSCICPTYGRVDVLEEAIYSFLKQDYRGSKELIILNDFEQQTLVFDHPEVRIINFPKRLRTLGEKYKAAVGLCSHDLIFVWHDDDIYLPHRLSYAVKQIYGNNTRPDFNLKKHKSFFRPDKVLVWNGQQLSGPAVGRFHGGSSWTRALFASVRGYAHINYGYDEELETQFEKDPQDILISDILPEDIYYIYRQGGNNTYHLSDFASDGAGNEYDRVAAFVQCQAEQGKIKQGHIELEPRWQTDYTHLVRDFLQAGKVAVAAK
ncbi:MAG: glycosyltransferase [Anaerolineae bacterium]|nr:glycosyltransferase [Anaerolineae bacterium]